MEETLVNLLKDSPVALFLLVALWYMSNHLDKVTKNSDSMLTALNEERTERMEEMKEKIASLETKSDECNNDRLKLHAEIIKIKVASGIKFNLVDTPSEEG